MEKLPQSDQMRLYGREALMAALKFLAGLSAPKPMEGQPDYGPEFQMLVDKLDTVLPAGTPSLKHFRVWAETVSGFASGQPGQTRSRLTILDAYFSWQEGHRFVEVDANIDGCSYRCFVRWSLIDQAADPRFAQLAELWQAYQASPTPAA